MYASEGKPPPTLLTRDCRFEPGGQHKPTSHADCLAQTGPELDGGGVEGSWRSHVLMGYGQVTGQHLPAKVLEGDTWGRGSVWSEDALMRCKFCVPVRACPSVCNKIAKVTSCAHSRCRVPCVRSTDVVGGGCKNQLGERSRRERRRERAKMLVLFSCTPPSSPARLSISGCHRRPAATLPPSRCIRVDRL